MLIYPAIFTKENDGYFVRFPDLEGCLTEGDSMKNAIHMAEEALGGYLASLYERNLIIPEPSEIATIKVDSENECVVIIYSNVDKYFSKTKAVKKTLSIPAWLNELADSQHLNFSAILQEALRQHLDL